jgi:hypothetical protein
VLGGAYVPALSQHPSQRCRDLQRVAPGGSFNKLRVSFAWNLLHPCSAPGDVSVGADPRVRPAQMAEPVPVREVARRMGLKSIKSLEGLL